MVAAIIPTVQIALRYIVIAAVQLGIWSAIEKYVLPQINGAIVAIMQKFGVSEEKAKDIMANDIIEFAESIGIFAVTLKSKMPLKLAELFGFTTKGWSKRALVTGVSKYIPAAADWFKILPKGATIVTKEAAPAIIQGAIKSKTGFKVAYDLLMKTLGVTFVGTLAISNVIDFGNWNSGAYQKKMQKVIAFLSLGTLTPDADYRTSKTLSPEIFDKIYNEYKILGAQYINDPYKKQHVVFTRDNMLDFLDVIGAELLRLDGTATTKEVNLAALPFIIFDESVEAPAVQQEVQAAKSVAQIKVFTGVVAQGKLAEGVTFVARETDLIDDINELQRAAENNLASFIMALPGKIIYEIKIVSSVTSKDGFTQRGTTQKIITGYFTSGAPKYKTVTNKFAQLKIYVITEKGTRTNIATVTLGPVNSAVFNPSGAEITLAEQEIKSNITTTDISEIKTIETTQPIAVEQTETPAAQPTTGPVSIGETPAQLIAKGMKVSNTYEEALNNLIPVDFYTSNETRRGFQQILVGPSPNVPFGFSKTDMAGAKEYLRQFPDSSVSGLQTNYTRENLLNNVEPMTDVVWAFKAPWGEILTNIKLSQLKTLTPPPGLTSGIPELESGNQNKCLAVSISEFFGGTIPATASVQERAKLYESWGLGQAAYYTGTAEQNNRFLAELKRRSGC